MTGALEAPAEYFADPESYLKVECHPEGWPYLHELQDANADIARLNAGLTSRKRILSEEGVDVREVDQENAEDKKRAEELGLKYEGSTVDVPQQDDDAGREPTTQAA
jgi:capsid protein